MFDLVIATSKKGFLVKVTESESLTFLIRERESTLISGNFVPLSITKMIFIYILDTSEYNLNFHRTSVAIASKPCNYFLRKWWKLYIGKSIDMIASWSSSFMDNFPYNTRHVEYTHKIV